MAEIAAAGGRARALAFDVSDLDAVTAAVAEIAAREGPVDILVNNAGTGGAVAPMMMAPFAKTPPEYWAQIIDMNLHNKLIVIKWALQYVGDGSWLPTQGEIAERVEL